MKEYTVCFKGEVYVTVKAASRDDAVDMAVEHIKNNEGYFKVRDTIVTEGE